MGFFCSLFGFWCCCLLCVLFCFSRQLLVASERFLPWTPPSPLPTGSSSWNLIETSAKDQVQMPMREKAMYRSKHDGCGTASVGLFEKAPASLIFRAGLPAPLPCPTRHIPGPRRLKSQKEKAPICLSKAARRLNGEKLPFMCPIYFQVP